VLKKSVRHRRRQCGGLTGTALVAAARLGARTGYAGLLGDDDLSRAVREHFHREGIDLSCAVPNAAARPAHSTIIVDQTHNTRTIFASLEGAIGADPLLPEADVIRSASVLLVDHHGLEGTLRAVRIARANGIGVVADFERDPGPPFAELLDAVDHLIVSERFGRELTGADNAARSAEKLCRGGRQAVVITCGAAGCWYAPSEGRPFARHFPAFAVPVVDTTGCGDVFHGAYAAALAEKRDLEDRIRWASATAALKAGCHGGPPGLPRREAVEVFLAERGSERQMRR
jgi:sugar/nucleoside kinase (ribokinase family)